MWIKYLLLRTASTNARRLKLLSSGFEVSKCRPNCCRKWRKRWEFSPRHLFYKKQVNMQIPRTNINPGRSSFRYIHWCHAMFFMVISLHHDLHGTQKSRVIRLDRDQLVVSLAWTRNVLFRSDIFPSVPNKSWICCPVYLELHLFTEIKWNSKLQMILFRKF